MNKKRWLHFGYINIIDEMGNTYKIIKITQKNELIIRIICNRTNIKVEKIGGTMPEYLPTPEKAFSRLKKNNLPD